MISAPTDTVRPAVDLASLALCRTDRPEDPSEPAPATATVDTGLGSINGIAVSGPLPPSNSSTNAASSPDFVMIEDKDDVKSVSSMQAMDLADSTDIPAPPTRPPPIPPRPRAQSKTKIGIVEESARQQDAAEVMGNIFDLISCAIKGEGLLGDGEQSDLIKNLFFSDVTTVRETAKGPEKLSELRHNYLVSPGGRDRHLYATLDDDFGQEEMEGGLNRYEYIDTDAPIQIINVRRIQWNREKKEQEYDRSHINLDSTLYLDRYLGKTSTLNEIELLKLREVQWAKQQELREANAKKTKLQDTGIDGMDLVNAVEESSAFVNELLVEKASLREHSGQDSLPTPPPELADALHNKAAHLQNDIDNLNDRISTLEAQVHTVFKDCHDRPYRLHAVFTHRGASTKGGHYWIYIYDFQNGIWRSYNDDKVEPVDEKDIFEREANQTWPKTSTGVVYIRADMVDSITQAVWRQPTKPETDLSGDTLGNGELTSGAQRDVEMPDAEEAEPPTNAEAVPPTKSEGYENLPVLEGIEKA